MGFGTDFKERRFGIKTRRTDPGVTLCGVDDMEPHTALEDADYSLTVEFGIGRGPEIFRNLFLRTFPATHEPAKSGRYPRAKPAAQVGNDIAEP